MKYMVFLFFAFGLMGNIQAQVLSDKIVGTWKNEDNTYKIEIYNVGETYSGKIVALANLENNPNAQPKDKNNPNPQLRNRSILGMDIITGLQHSGGKWINGTIYAPKKGIYADCNVELLSNGQLKVIVSKSGFTKTQLWSRI